jgi:hypothetical protein
VLKKILRHRLAQAIIVSVLKLYVTLIFKLCPITIRFHSEAKKLISENQPALFCYWHSRILLFPRLMTGFGRFAAVISAHGDGEYLNQVIASYGHQTVRGSSRKNSLQAMMGIIKIIKHGISIGITPDGPKGPRFKIKGAIGELALKYDLPVIPMTYSASHAYILKTWDRFILPLPIKSRIIIEIGKPIHITKKDEQPNIRIEEIMLKQTYNLDRELNLKVDYQ